MNLQTSIIHAADDALALGTDPIPAKYYYDPEWFEAERQAVFMRSWINIGHVCELPEVGSFVKRDLEFARASLLVVRGKDGEIRAMHNVCTHRGTQLVDEAAGRKNTFSCRYHMWTFGADGALISAPDFERFYTTKDKCALPQVATEVCGGLIFINFNPQQTLREYLGDMAPILEGMAVARATTFSEYTYDVNANWKLTYDNFQENYHLRFIHPKTGTPTYNAQTNPFGYPEHFTLNGMHRTQTIWTNPEAQFSDMQMLGFQRGMKRLAADGLLQNPHGRTYLALFPSLFLLGSPGNHFLHNVYPVGPEKSRGVIRIYWCGEDETASVRYAREATMATTRDVHSEDVCVIEAGQRGLSSGALEHVHFMEKEILCRHLIKVVEEKVEAWKAETAAAG